MKLKDILNEKIEIDVEIGDTILVGRFKNKKLVVKDIGKDSHGMPTINGRKVTTFRTTKNVNENKEEIKVLHSFLTKYTKSAKKASAMIKKNYKRVKKQFRGDSSRDVAMALIGYDAIGENKDLFKMYTQAMKMMPGSPKQKELIKKISSLRKKLKMNEKEGSSVPYGSGYKKMIKEMSPEKRAFLMLRIYGDSWKVNLGKVFSGINKQKPGMIKKGLKEIKILNKKIEDMIEDLV